MIRPLFLLSFLLAAGVVAAAEASDPEPVYVLEKIQPGLPKLEGDPINLETPQACVENFMLSCRDKKFDRAARSLNFRLLEPVDEERARDLAARLFYVLNQELWIDWEALPDRADGMEEGGFAQNTSPMIGKPRRNLPVGSIEIDGREIPIRVQRVKTEDREPIWLFSAQSVENIDRLYETHGPRWFDRNMPEWARARGWGRIALWKWIVIGLAFLLAPVLGYGMTFIARKALSRYAPVNGPVTKKLMWPIGSVTTSVVFLVLLEWAIALPGPIASVVDPLALIAVVASFAWLCMTALTLIIEHIAKDAIRRHYDQDESSDQQRLLTQITVIRHVLTLVVALSAFGILMVHLDLFRTLGMAMLSSAGAAAVILGIAGHAVLGNLIAGLQIALTRPFALGDTVYIEDNWGRIEDISYTHVIVRTWDLRRLVLPINYFVSHHFENWTLTNTKLVKPIYLHVDYEADVSRIRDKFFELLEGDEDWAKEDDDPEVLVTDTQDDTMVVRLTCAGHDSSAAWALHCRIRETIVAWLQQVEGGRYLPRRRLDVRTRDKSEEGRTPEKKSGPSGKGDGAGESEGGEGQ